MNMTPEQRIESNYAALQAHKAGKPVEYWSEIQNDWRSITNPVWDDYTVYRPKPEPVHCPWLSREDFPKLETPVWLRQNGVEGTFMVIGINAAGVWTHQGFLSWWQLESFQWSTFKTEYKPCTITEEVK
jgi:hypothetical protein